MTARDGSMTDMENSLTTAGTQKPLPKIAAWVIALTAAGVSVATGGLWLILVLWYILIPVAVGVSLVYGVYRLIIRGKEGWLRNPFAWPDLLTPVATMLDWPFSRLFPGFRNKLLHPAPTPEAQNTEQAEVGRHGVVLKISAPLPLRLLCVENQPRPLATAPCFHLTREPDYTIISP